MKVEVRSLTHAPFCRQGIKIPVDWAEMDLPPSTVAELERERFVSVREPRPKQAIAKSPPTNPHRSQKRRR